MELTSFRVEHTEKQVFTLTLTDREIVIAKLDEADRAVLADCASADATIADKLLGLELMARRIGEAQA